jgi:hypothetical protein
MERKSGCCCSLVNHELIQWNCYKQEGTHDWFAETGGGTSISGQQAIMSTHHTKGKNAVAVKWISPMSKCDPNYE